MLSKFGRRYIYRGIIGVFVAVKFPVSCIKSPYTTHDRKQTAKPDHLENPIMSLLLQEIEVAEFGCLIKILTRMLVNYCCRFACMCISNVPLGPTGYSVVKTQVTKISNTYTKILFDVTALYLYKN